MEPSFTKDQLGKLFVDLAIHKVETWTLSNLEKLRKTKTFPICIQLSNTKWVIGLFNLEKNGDKCWKMTKDGRLIHEFYSKQSAFFYAIFDSTHHYLIAQNLLFSDKKCAKYSDEIILFNNKLNKETISKDKRDILTMRLMNAKVEFEKARIDLKKSLNRAKYHKIWENMP
jgi:hypothetical protein